MRQGVSTGDPMGGLTRRKFVGGTLVATAWAAADVRAQSWPSRPIRLVVPFPPGGPSDTLARVLAQRLGERLGQPCIVDNHPGAGGTLGSDLVARAAADGHTLLLATTSTHSIAPALSPKLPYDAAADFTPIAALADAPGVVLVPQSSPATTLRELIELARRQPGQLSYASSGIGTIVHLSTEYFKAETGTYIVHIPYRGTALAMNDLVAGTVDLLFDSVLTGLPQARAGRVRALAVTSLQRSPLAPGLPAVAEVVPGYEAVTWFGLYGPRGLPPELAARLNEVVNGVLAEPEVRERLARMGAEPTGGSAAAFARRVQAETLKWARLAAERGIRLD